MRWFFWSGKFYLMWWLLYAHFPFCHKFMKWEYASCYTLASKIWVEEKNKSKVVRMCNVPLPCLVAIIIIIIVAISKMWCLVFFVWIWAGFFHFKNVWRQLSLPVCEIINHMMGFLGGNFIIFFIVPTFTENYLDSQIKYCSHMTCRVCNFRYTISQEWQGYLAGKLKTSVALARHFFWRAPTYLWTSFNGFDVFLCKHGLLLRMFTYISKTKTSLPVCKVPSNSCRARSTSDSSEAGKMDMRRERWYSLGTLSRCLCPWKHVAKSRRTGCVTGWADSLWPVPPSLIARHHEKCEGSNHLQMDASLGSTRQRDAQAEYMLDAGASAESEGKHEAFCVEPPHMESKLALLPMVHSGLISAPCLNSGH